ncbi:hypothetical protein OTAKU_00560 [Serratia phage vB_SmaM-Otaku]|uniref:Uncharacterized protein n=1 Tax=Serratia phage vB_SmaM-Otaku TaxID=2932867 RepID=A0AAE9HHD7_9CAUD|nr:hypothetical protein PF631_gp56 [Serratia phage vB_SmaM-Otaku]UPU16045.1 hypothetical protein OTAKU_00560 [Serratia phage vB_SmaM-Otaku]
MMKMAKELIIGDQLTGDLDGIVTNKFSTMDKDRNRCVALVLETSDGWRDATLPIAALVAVKAPV